LRRTCCGIDTPARVAMFVAQVAVESGDFTRVRESLNYSAEALLKLFGRHRISEAECHAYGRTAQHPANQAKLADLLYGGEWGRKNLGNTEIHDGSRFIGRGLKQLTGRSNYERCSRALYGDVRLVNLPETLERSEAAALSACWFWDANHLNKFADNADCNGCTKAVNGGAIGLDQRTANFERILGVIG
jgi:putative chitinase